ncbi:MAG: hypothetical protein JSC189_001130 [Candidatus Tokpelaia sp. JSC189]|nr:MAG: hypothetical protein JSC189_001130 [Candidatus Tokpelaia sp. JSC189]
MAEDSFICEINQELRQEKARSLWRRYGSLLVSAAVILVLVITAVQGYTTWIDGKASRIGDSFLATFELTDKAGQGRVLAKLAEIEKSGFGAYPALAKMRKATILVNEGKRIDAVALLDNIVANVSTPEILKNMASVRAAYILVDIGSFADVEERVKRLATNIDPMRFAARDALGLAAWRTGRIADSVYYFSKIRDDKGAAGTGFLQRADMMLDLLQNKEKQTEG